MMLHQDLERWQRYLNPGIHDSAPPTDHTDRELLIELVNEAMEVIAEDYPGQITKLEEELGESEKELEGCKSQTQRVQDALYDLKQALESQALEEALEIVERLENA